MDRETGNKLKEEMSMDEEPKIPKDVIIMNNNTSTLNINTPIPKVGKMADMIIEYMSVNHNKYQPINHSIQVPDRKVEKYELEKKEKEFFRRYEKILEQKKYL